LFFKRVKQSFDINVCICFVIDSFIVYINLIFNILIFNNLIIFL